MNILKPSFLLAAVFLVGRTSPCADLVSYVNPMCGTDGDANLVPGPVVPFGMIQFGPDTGPTRRDGGYAYKDKHITGFSVDRMSGGGCPVGGNFSMMPILGGADRNPPADRMALAATFSHANETARPGYYSVALDNGIKVEMTTTTRTGFGRFTFPAGAPATLAINGATDVNGAVKSEVRVDQAKREVSGWATGGHFCGSIAETTTYFCAVFDRPIIALTTWGGGEPVKNKSRWGGSAAGAYASFDLPADRTLSVKVAISYVSVAGAEANLTAESPTDAFTRADFDRTAANAAGTWNSWLNKIQVSGGAREDLEAFYSIFYHALMAPTVCSDADGKYRGNDGEVHDAGGRTRYANFSGWDTYRDESQFLAMIAPKEAGDMAESLVDDYKLGGTFPRFGVPTIDAAVMMADAAAPIIADFHAFGATHFDTQAALAGLLRAATDPGVYAPRSDTWEREGLSYYIKLGYLPEDTFEFKRPNMGDGTVSTTLEYASDDFALSQFAAALGDSPDATMLLKRAQNWKNLFNPEVGWMAMRRADGTWAPGFANNVLDYDGHHAFDEGTSGQYTWMVPFNLKALAAKMGGPVAAASRLDACLTKLNVGPSGPDSWMAWMGNETSIGAPWIYCFLDCPYKTQQAVRRVMTELYSAAPNGYPGNDDLGSLSAWYVFGALGMYPELPGSDVLVLGSPLFESAVVHLQGGDLAIIGKGAAKDAPYVHALAVNGKASTKPWIRFSDVAKGGKLEFTLGKDPDPGWGSDPADAPPSYDAP